HPLRSRQGALPILIDHFVEKAARQLGKETPTVPMALHQLLRTYSFPGNVRELEALVFDAVARHQGVTLSLASFKEAIFGTEEPEPVEAGALTAGLAERLPTLKTSGDRLISEEIG